MSQDAQTPNNLSDTGTWRRIAVEAHTKQGWATTDRHRDRPTGRRDPLRVYARKAAIWDTVAIVAAAAIGFILRWTIPYNLNISDSTYVIFALVVVVSWSVALVIRGAYDTRVLGVGSEEFKRVITASAGLFGGVAIVAFAFKLDLSRDILNQKLQINNNDFDYLIKVMRQKIGDEIIIFNGFDGDFIGKIIEIPKKNLNLRTC